MKEILFIFSIVFNLFAILFIYFFICKKGGMRFIKKKLRIQQVHEDNGFGPYYDQRKSLFKYLPQQSDDILFIGHSLIDGCEWAELLENPRIKNRGINGEIVKGVLIRVEEILITPPAKIFLMIGTNDIDHGYEAPEILKNYEKIIVFLNQRCPDTKIYLISMLPVFKHLRHQVNTIPEDFNTGLLKLTNKYNCHYVDLYNQLQDANGHLVENYSNDGWHLMGEGYVKVKGILWPLVND